MTPNLSLEPRLQYEQLFPPPSLSAFNTRTIVLSLSVFVLAECHRQDLRTQSSVAALLFSMPVHLLTFFVCMLPASSKISVTPSLIWRSVPTPNARPATPLDCSNVRNEQFVTSTVIRIKVIIMVKSIRKCVAYRSELNVLMG